MPAEHVLKFRAVEDRIHDHLKKIEAQNTLHTALPGGNLPLMPAPIIDLIGSFLSSTPETPSSAH
jgi:hypothetical protein